MKGAAPLLKGDSMREKIVLIDGHSILNRAFFGIPELTNAKGVHTNAVYGFLNIMFSILGEEEPDYLAVAFDRSEPTFRHQMYQAYKGTRKPTDPNLREQVPLMKQVLTAMGIPIYEQAGLEADDILGTIAKQAEEKGLTVRILSGDRDLLQLATQQTMIRIPKTKRGGTEVEDYLEADVRARYQVTPREFIDVKALMGDASDNIPGVAGIGEKTATALIAKYGSIEETFAHIDEVTPNRARNALAGQEEIAKLSKMLATIRTDAAIDFDLEASRLQNPYTQEAYALFQELEFKNMLARFGRDASVRRTELQIRLLCDLEEIAAFLQDGLGDGGDGVMAVNVYTQPDGAHRHALYGVSVSFGAAQTAFLAVPKEEQRELLSLLQDAAAQCGSFVSADLKTAAKFLALSPGKCEDTTIAAYLLNPLKNGYPYEDTAREYAGEILPSSGEILGKLKPAAAMMKDKEKFCEMAGYETYGARIAAAGLLEALKAQGMDALYREIEIPLAFTLADMENTGICADKEALRAFSGELSGQIDALQERIYEQAGETFNINSPKQLGGILFEKLQMPHGKKTKTGYSTSADILEKLAPDYPIVADILTYRQLTKLKSTYADGLVPCIEEDGRIRTTFTQTVTATGRLSSTDPNLQNIPIRTELGRELRRAFVASKGCVLIDADYSQIELRILAHMSADENLIRAYGEAKDIHATTASEVFGVPFDEVTPLMRRNAKAVNFGIVYGISSFGLSQDLSITRKEAQEYIERYFETYPGIRQFLDGAVADAKEKGYTKTLFGRRRPVPEIASGNFMQRSFGERIAMNAPIQGTAADIIKIAMNRVHARLLDAGLRARLVLQVHDELLIEAPYEEQEQVEQILAEEMPGAADLSVHLEIDMHSGPSWYEAH